MEGIERKSEEQPGLPKAFVCRMKEWLSEEYPLFLASYQEPRTQGLRLNGLKGDLAALEKVCRLWFHLEPVPWTECGFYYGEEDRPGKHPYHEAGLYYIQEPSAMAVVEALGVEPGDRVLDLCAAPGGKSTQIAARLQGKGLLVSNEIHPARAKILSQNIERMGAANVVVMNHDAQVLAQWLPGFFDKIVVDAPCSGEGMFRKEPKVRDEWNPDAPLQCSLRQQEILACAALMLKPGGRLVYSTCTFAPEENEGTIEAFLEKHSDFLIEDSAKQRRGFAEFGPGKPEWIPGGKRKENQRDQKWQETFRLWPHQIRGEGHYLAVLGKKNISEDKPGDEIKISMKNRVTAAQTPGKKREKRGLLCRDNPEGEKAFTRFCQEMFAAENGKRQDKPQGAGRRQDKPQEAEEIHDGGSYLLFGDQLYVIPEGLPDIRGKKILRPGLHLGSFKKNRFEPSHALALHVKREQVNQWANLDSQGELVIRYLKGETLMAEDGVELSHPDASGWILVTVDGYSLGWAKLAGGRLKNHYPKGLRWV